LLPVVAVVDRKEGCRSLPPEPAHQVLARLPPAERVLVVVVPGDSNTVGFLELSSLFEPPLDLVE